MADGYSWSEMRNGGGYRLPGAEHLGWWATLAMLLSILLHIAVFLILDQMKIGLRFEQAAEINTRNLDLRQTVRPDEPVKPPTAENVVTPPADAAELLEEVDLLAVLPKNEEIDMKPSVTEPEFALQMQNPALKGDPAAIAMEVSAGLDASTDLPELGREPERLKPAEVGRLVVDPGAVTADDHDLGKITESLIQRGANGTVNKGALDGVASLDELLGLPSNALLGKKTMLPSDLLFEFNSDQLRESAKVGLMKLALLMDRNPGLYCWIEGHTDMVGSDAFNMKLSLRRAEAVKSYLIESLRMDAGKIRTRGFGRSQPLVTAGTAEQQAINRRVEIRMRKDPPSGDIPALDKPKAPVEQNPPPKPVLVKPRRPLPDAEPPVAPPVTPPRPAARPPRATPVAEPPPAVPRARPVDLPPPPRATPVQE